MQTNLLKHTNTKALKILRLSVNLPHNSCNVITTVEDLHQKKVKKKVICE